MTQRHPIQNDRTILVTTVTRKRMPLFSDAAHAREVIECLYRVQTIHPFFLYGFVIMPDHCHFLIKVPAPGTISKVMNSFKAGVTFDLGLAKVWQPRFHIRCIDNVSEALRYIHANPVRRGLVEYPEAFPWSSASGKWNVDAIQEF